MIKRNHGKDRLLFTKGEQCKGPQVVKTNMKYTWEYDFGNCD